MLKFKNVTLSFPNCLLDDIKKYRDRLEKKHGVKIGISAIFVSLIELAIKHTPGFYDGA